ncbi:RAD55 family ATPase [Methanobacterium alcaliphilum]|uniref:RAD55 family ATPase n=1 Tax=Methanobacterium alcaliphilum TaxID=392018 RepID=UPI00200B120F|nr:RAD55 family ATPase [Methanobacterium alcaliphilum]MCK9152483.1 RAD55 family ATPase [Methanobacterium alcaliphilum]
MSENFESGIPGFDAMLAEKGLDGIPKGTVSLIYGPPKVGKSIFCYQFMYNGLLKEEPCLYITADYGWKQLEQRAMDFNWFLKTHLDNQNIYVIDLLSRLSGMKLEDSTNHKFSSIQNPTDMMVKVGTGTRTVFQKSTKFRSVFDSLTTQFAFNPPNLVLRVVKSYIDRIREANGMALITQTYGSVDDKIDEYLIKIVDNLIIMDGNQISFESSEIDTIETNYNINNSGIVIK